MQPDRPTESLGSLGALFGDKKPGPSSQEFADALKSIRFDPGTSQLKAAQIALSLNVDGRTLAQAISEQLDYLYEHATGAPAYNGQSHFNRADGGMMGT